MGKLRNGPIVLAILDGFGIAPDSKGNGVTRAKTPFLDKFITTYPTTTLVAAGESVGLSWGEMGNSEVDHTNIGSGLVFYQNMPKINQSIKNESFFENGGLLKSMHQVKEQKSNLHIMGLIGSGGVHGFQEHWYAILKMAAKNKVKKVYLHIFLDGRDSLYNSGRGFVEELIKGIKETKSNAEIATVSGRFYAM